MRAGASLCDQGTGVWLVLGVLAMLQRRAHTGQGGIVSASLLETALMWCGPRIDALNNLGRITPRDRIGHPGLVPYEAFMAADGPFMICAGNDRLFSKLATVLDRPAWAADERFATNRARLIHKAALVAEMAPLLAARPCAEWLAQLDAAGIPACRIHDIPQAQAEPHVQALGMVQPVPEEDFALMALPLSFDGARPAFAGPAPRLGADNEALGI